MPDIKSLPRPAVFAAEARRTAEAHAVWDSLDTFITLHWDGERFAGGIYAAIDTGFTEEQYPQVMIRIARKEMEKNPERPPCGYLLQNEAYVAEVPAGATAEEHAAFDKAVRNRELHRHPGARECVQVFVADVHGNLWGARKYRDNGEVTGWRRPPQERTSSLLEAGLIACARATGLMSWGLAPAPAERQALDQVHRRFTAGMN